jgi:hypothetical protein
MLAQALEPMDRRRPEQQRDAVEGFDSHAPRS